MDDQSTYVGQTAAAKLAALAKAAAKNAITVDDQLYSQSTHPVQNKVVTAALGEKAGKDVATQYINGLMSAADKAKLDGIEAGATKNSTATATADADGLMSAADKVKLDGIEDGATKTIVDDAMSDTSTNPVQNKVVTAELAKKAGKDVATADADGLMSAADKVKLDGIEDGATRTIVDDVMSDTSTNPVQNKVIKQYVDEKGVNYFDTYVEKPTKEQLTAYADYYTCKCKATHTYAEIAAALAKDMVPRVLLVDVIGSVGANRIVCPLNEYYNGTDGSYNFDAPNIVGVYGTGIVDISDDGAYYTCSAGELPPVTDKSNGKCLVVDGGKYRCGTPATATQSTPGYMSAADKSKLDGVEAGATKTTVDAVLDAASENPVQNKAVKAALDGKLSKLGGEISGHLDVGQTVSAEGAVSVGRTSTDTGIHFEKAASDAGRISHGSDPMTGVSPIARLKVASPTEDDDAATKAYVDGAAVRYDAAQTLDDAQKAQARDNIDAPSAFAPILTSPVMIRKFGETESAGVYLSTIDTGEKWAEIRLEDVNENAPVAIANLRTPTGAGKDDYAATKGYVDSKVASGSGVTVDTAMSGTSTNPVQNKVIKQYVDGKVAAAGSNITVDAALSSTSTNPVQNKAVKAAIDAKADKTALDAKADKTALGGKLDKAGGTLTGNLIGKYITGTWLQSTAAANLGKTPGKIAVLDDSGWVYYRTPAELLADIGAMSGGGYYTKAETDAAIAVRASTSAYGTTKLSNSTTSSSKTLAATPYAVKTALAQAKAYVDSAIAVAINSAY